MDIEEVTKKMRKGNAKKVAEWIASGNKTFTYAQISQELGIDRDRLFMIMHVMKRWGFRFNESYDPSGKWGGNEKVYSLIGITTEKETAETESKESELWKLALSI